MTGQPPAGWYPDPSGRPFHRYWDGRAWTSSTRGLPQAGAAPAAQHGRPPQASGGPGTPPTSAGPAAPQTPGRRAAPRPPYPAYPARPANARPPEPIASRTAAPAPAAVESAPDRGPARPLRPGIREIAVAVAALVPAAAGALAIVAPIAYGLRFVAPVWGPAVPFAAWVIGAVVATWPTEGIQRAWYGYRDPTADELRRLAEPSRRALRRLGVTAGCYRLMIIESRAPSAPAVAGRTVVMTSYAVSTLPPDRMEAAVAHELSHHVGRYAVPVFCHTVLTLPIRAVWWLLARIWQPVRRMWRVAVRWHTPFGFLVTFLLAIAVAVIFVVSAIPAGIAFVGAALSRFSVDRSEYLADAAVADLGLGQRLLQILETAIESGHAEGDRTARLLPLPPLVVRRAQRLRRRLAA